VLLGVGGFLLTARTIRNDRDADAERDARTQSIASQEILGRARAYMQGLSNVLASEARPGQVRFATLAAGTAASVGLDDVLWVQRVPGSERRRYERRLGAPISRLTASGRFERAPGARLYLPATFTSETRPELRPGVDVSSFPGLADSIRNRGTIFAVTASKAGSLGDEPGFYLLQAAGFGHGRGSRGFLAAFVPRGWFVTTLGGDPGRVAVTQDGQPIEGQLDSAAGAASFDTLGRRWRVDVAREPRTGLQSALPWLALAWPIAIALIAFLVGRAIMLRRRAEREFEEIFNVSPDLLGIIGFDGYFKRVNPAFEQAFGYSSELLSRPIFDFVHQDDVPMSREEFERATGGKTVTGFENRNIRADGSLLWLEWSAQPLPEEHIVYAAARDITERKHAEDELHEARAAVEASRAELAVYAEDQAALRRVATLVAEGASPVEVLDTVVGEVGRLFGAHATRLLRYEGDDAATVVAVDGTDEGLQVGTRLTLEGESIAASVRRTGRPARMKDYERAPGSVAAQVRKIGMRSAVGTPITVEGGLWGVIIAAWTQEEPPFAEAEARMAAFTELVATAIANAESRAQLDVHVEQQAALRRVATLVAQGASPQDLFEAVAEELGRLLSVASATMGRFEPDGSVIVVASWSSTEEAAFPTGGRWSTEATNLSWRVLQTGRTARRDDFSAATDPVGVTVREAGIKSAVGSPIVVEGHIWGHIVVASTEGPMPPDTEARLASFTELVATAIANAESRALLDVHVEQQAALRRVATLVAEDVPPSELFEAVVREVGTLLGSDFAGLARFEDDAVVTVGVWAADGEHPPVPPRWPMRQDDPATKIAESREPERWDDWTGVPGPIAEFIRGLGIRSTVGTPIGVAGRLWGALALHSKQSDPLPPDTESRMAQFTDLVATAIANREARAEVDRLADEQAALRRVATLVAQGDPSRKIIDAVASEVVQLLGTDLAIVYRFDPDDQMTALAATGLAASKIPVGTRLPVPSQGVAGEIRRTGRPARRDDYEGMSGKWRQIAEETGSRSGVGAPITVEGDIWGVICVGSASDRPLPADAERRLAQFTDLVGTAISNTESRAELAASRARVVAAAAEERRRVVRDLHDGAQQRLVHAVITLKLLLRGLGSGDVEPGVREALAHAERANAELRELVHGILPGALTSGGLRAGVDELVSRAALPVSADVLKARFPEPIEATAYFVVSEALTNAMKHSQAHSAEVAAQLDNGTLLVEVRDDGVGGADPSRGSGLTGLRDRVEALGGTIEISSPAGNGTSVTARLPADVP
jgi:PAS domain S-box-containing protein